MNFEEFKKKTQPFSFILAKEKRLSLKKTAKSAYPLKKRGLIRKLRRGAYLLNQRDYARDLLFTT